MGIADEVALFARCLELADEFLTAPDGGLYNTYAEGGRPEDAVADLGARWELCRIALRLWPAATPLQDVITALYDLVERHGVDFGDIENVRIALSKTPFDMHGGFATYGAKFEALLSAHYVAAVYLRGRVRKKPPTRLSEADRASARQILTGDTS